MSASKSRTWRTGAQLVEIRRYAAEGLSQTRTAAVMGLTRGQIAGAALYYGIRFCCDSHEPRPNRVRRYATTPEELRAYHARKQREWRARQRGAG